jgi:hypothetical protein
MDQQQQGILSMHDPRLHAPLLRHPSICQDQQIIAALQQTTKELHAAVAVRLAGQLPVVLHTKQLQQTAPGAVAIESCTLTAKPTSAAAPQLSCLAPPMLASRNSSSTSERTAAGSRQQRPSVAALCTSRQHMWTSLVAAAASSTFNKVVCRCGLQQQR